MSVTALHLYNWCLRVLVYALAGLKYNLCMLAHTTRM